MRKLAWFALQVPIVGLFLWGAYLDAEKTGEPAKIGPALAIGLLIAFSLTFALSFIIDRFRLLSVRWRGWLRSQRLRRKIDKPSGDGTGLTASGRSLGELPKPFSRLRIGE